MSVLEQILGAYGPGHGLEHEGKRYVFSLIDQKKKQALSAAYFERARQGVYLLRDLASDEQYGRLLERVADAYRRGEYAFPGGEAAAYYLGEGLPEMVAALTGCERAEAESLCQDRSVECLHVVMCVVASSFPQVKKKMVQQAADGDPEMDKLAALLADAA